MSDVFCTSCETAIAGEDAFCRACGHPQPATPFVPMSLARLGLLCAGTLGFFVFVWFYRQWRATAAATGARIRPFWRALFFPVTAQVLFEAVNAARAADARGPFDRAPQLHARTLASVLTLLTWAAPLLLPGEWKFVWLLGGLPLMPVQASINALHRASGRRPARRARLAPWLALPALAGLALALYLGASLSGVIPPANVLAGRMLSARQDAMVRRLAGLEDGETIEYFFSAGFFSYAEDGNVVTDRRLVSYYRDSAGQPTLDWVEYREIRSLHVLYGDANGYTSIVACIAGGDKMMLYSSGERAQDRQMIAAIRARLFPGTLVREETREDFTCPSGVPV